MPELRQDPTTREWVVIASDRAKRPAEFPQIKPRDTKKEGLCVLCAGNEALTPKEVYALRESGPADGPGWRVRVVPNKFPAFTPGETLQRSQVGRMFQRANATGHHEVIIETPQHSASLATLTELELLDVLNVYRQRYLALHQANGVELVLIFRNHGPTAGTSLAHPHSQLIATPIIPLRIRQRYDVAVRHYDDTGRCLYCEVLAGELESGARVVLDGPSFAVIHPFASRVPFETWILPKRHNPSFGKTTASELRDLAGVLRAVLRGLYVALGDPDFNLVVHTAPLVDEDKPYFLWHIEIRPRLTTPAGFELGTGIYINTALPEQTAPFLREATQKRRGGVQ